jgi:hypothetical protein
MSNHEHEGTKPRSLAEIAASMHATAGKTPSTVVRAFLPDRLKAAGVVLRPLNTEMWLFLEKLSSPFSRNMTEAPPTIEQIMEAFYVIVTDPDVVDEQLAAGLDAFRKTVRTYARSIPMREFPGISEALAAHIAAEFDPQGDLGPASSSEDGDSPLAPSLSAATAPAAP